MDLFLHKLRRNLGDALRTSLRPVILDCDVATGRPTEFARSLGKSSARHIDQSARSNVYKRDGRQLARLLRLRGKRARDRYAAKKRKEFTPSHRYPPKAQEGVSGRSA